MFFLCFKCCWTEFLQRIETRDVAAHLNGENNEIIINNSAWKKSILLILPDDPVCRDAYGATGMWSPDRVPPLCWLPGIVL